MECRINLAEEQWIPDWLTATQTTPNLQFNLT